ncbi:MAG: NAD(+) synthase [Actinomyces massiliensis]
MHQDAPPPPPAGRPTIEFRSAYDQGFARVAAVTLPVALADPAANAAVIIDQARSLSDDGVCLAAFPELSLTGYSIDDLLLSDVLLDEVLAAIETIRAASAGLLPAIIVGAPLRDGSRLYNCAVVIQGGVVRGVAPKSYLPTYREFYEKRHFASGDGAPGAQRILLPAVRAGAEAAAVGNAVGDRDDGARVPFGPHLLFEVADVPGLTFHVEVCEDMWVPVPPSSLAALAGATVLVNLSGSPITVGRAEDRKLLARASSARNLAAYVFAAAGQGESSTDLAWDGQTFVYENGELLGETERFPDGPRATVVDVDIEGLRAERLRQGSFEDNRAALSRAAAPAGLAGSSRFLTLSIEPRELRVPRTDIGLRRAVDRFPFVPDDPARLAQDCYEAYSIQVAALAQRLRAIGLPTIVIGVSGGLDSTHALIVAARAVDRLGLGREHIHAITMPGFATSEGTKSNALALARALGCHVEELDIRPAAEQMLTAMDHPYGRGQRGREVYDVTFENVQAGLRTDFLFRIANQRGGIVLGTGDLSELALGWCTYGVGDQMSHYAVNTGVLKAAARTR